MTNKELQEKLSVFPADLPIMFKVDQELTGSDDFAWLRGEVSSVEVDEIYTLREEFLVDRDRMRDEINDEPLTFGLSEDATDDEVEAWLDKKREIVLAVRVTP